MESRHAVSDVQRLADVGRSVDRGPWIAAAKNDLDSRPHASAVPSYGEFERHRAARLNVARRNETGNAFLSNCDPHPGEC